MFVYEVWDSASALFITVCLAPVWHADRKRFLTLSSVLVPPFAHFKTDPYFLGRMESTSVAQKQSLASLFLWYYLSNTQATRAECFSLSPVTALSHQLYLFTNGEETSFTIYARPRYCIHIPFVYLCTTLRKLKCQIISSANSYVKLWAGHLLACQIYQPGPSLICLACLFLK